MFYIIIINNLVKRSPKDKLIHGLSNLKAWEFHPVLAKRFSIYETACTDSSTINLRKITGLGAVKPHVGALKISKFLWLVWLPGYPHSSGRNFLLLQQRIQELQKWIYGVILQRNIRVAVLGKRKSKAGDRIRSLKWDLRWIHTQTVPPRVLIWT